MKHAAFDLPRDEDIYSLFDSLFLTTNDEPTDDLFLKKNERCFRGRVNRDVNPLVSSRYDDVEAAAKGLLLIVIENLLGLNLDEYTKQVRQVSLVFQTSAPD